MGCPLTQTVLGHKAIRSAVSFILVQVAQPLSLNGHAKTHSVVGSNRWASRL
jgi:hypothetical protein